MRITVPTLHGPHAIDAIPTGNPALVINRPVNEYGDPLEDGWKITHKRTGYAITNELIDSRRAAVMMAERLGDLDWDFDAEGAPAGAAGKPYQEAIKRVWQEVDDEIAAGRGAAHGGKQTP